MEKKLKRKKWSEEEIRFLKFAYQSKEFSINDICKALGRSKKSINIKAFRLNLKIYREDIPSGFKRCSKCKTIHSIEHFYVEKCGRVNSWCKECWKELYRKKKNAKNIKNNSQEAYTTNFKKCTICENVKAIHEFSKNKNIKGGYLNQCKECVNKYNKEYRIKKLKERGWV